MSSKVSSFMEPTSNNFTDTKWTLKIPIERWTTKIKEHTCTYCHSLVSVWSVTRSELGTVHVGQVCLGLLQNHWNSPNIVFSFLPYGTCKHVISCVWWMQQSRSYLRHCYTRQFFMQLVLQLLKAFQLHEQGCCTVQLDWQQLANLRPRRTEERIIRILIGWSSKALREKLLEGCYTVQLGMKVAAIIAKSRTELYFVQHCAQQKCCETSCRGNMLHRAILLQFVSQQRCETSCRVNCMV